MSDACLRGRHILVVEDNAILAICYQGILEAAGAEVVGPAMTLAEAEKLAATEQLSAALLDIRFDHEKVWPVARLLASNGVPFVFCSGHVDGEHLPAEWAGRPILINPARAQAIIDTVANLFHGQA